MRISDVFSFGGRYDGHDHGYYGHGGYGRSSYGSGSYGRNYGYHRGDYGRHYGGLVRLDIL
jgi:hypothetical protein